MEVQISHQKFIVVADQKTGKPLELFFDSKIASIHEHLFIEAAKQYKLKNMDISVHGGGYFSVIGNYVLFFSQSHRYKRFENDVVLELAPKHPFFKDKGYTFIAKTGWEDDWSLIPK